MTLRAALLVSSLVLTGAPAAAQARWSRAAMPPLERYGLAYDTARQRAVLFGGRSAPSGPALAGTWEWDGTFWRARHAPASPPARRDPAMAYDAARGVTLLFGGAAGTTRFRDTWAWDGVTWKRLAPGTTPPAGEAATSYDSARRVVVLCVAGRTFEWNGKNWQARAGAAPVLHTPRMAYDAFRKRTVLFGLNLATGRGELWEWNGAAWSRAPVARVPPLYKAAMAYDATRRRLVIHGGEYRDTATRSADTWEYDGRTLTKALASPTRREHHAMVFVPRQRVVLTFGGWVDLPVFAVRNDTVVYDGASWLEPAAPTPARSEHGMAYDPRRGFLVLFGGRTGKRGVLDRSTWELVGASWKRRRPRTVPGGTQSLLVYSPANRAVLLFDGARTWLWNGLDWRDARPATSPPARSYAALAGGPLGPVLFGGLDRAGRPLGDTWWWTGTSWVHLRPATAPLARAGHAMAYDATRGRTVLFGGRIATGPTAETWEWDGRAWHRLAPAASPSARAFHAMAFDTLRCRVVLFGGAGASAQSWSWDGRTWTPGVTAPQGPRAWHAMAYDPRGGRVVTFGGIDPRTGATAGTWALGRRVLAPDRDAVSLSAGGTQRLVLDAGPARARFGYLVVGSLSGTTPGVILGPCQLLPLRFDLYTLLTSAFPNSVFLPGSVGVLDGAGRATAGFHLPPGAVSATPGTTLHHAAIVLGPNGVELTSNAVAVTLER